MQIRTNKIPDDTRKKGFKAEKETIITSHRLLQGSKAIQRRLQIPVKHQRCGFL